MSVEPLSQSAPSASVGRSVLADLEQRLRRCSVGEAEERRGAMVDLASDIARLEAALGAVKARCAARLEIDFRAEHLSDLAKLERHQRPSRNPAAELVDRREVAEAHRLAHRQASLALSCALGTSTVQTDRLLDLGHELNRRPTFAKSVSAGRLDIRQAEIIADGINALPLFGEQIPALMSLFLGDPDDPQERPYLVRELRPIPAEDGRAAVAAPPLWQLPPRKLAPLVRREVARLYPESVRLEAESNRECRELRHRPEEAGLPAQLVLTGPGPELAAAYAWVDARARAAKAAGEPGALGQIRHDVALGALTGGAFGLVVREPGATGPEALGPGRDGATTCSSGVRPTALINITVPALALVRGRKDRRLVDPAVLHTPQGDSPVDVELVRELIAEGDVLLRTVTCHPQTGVATDVSRRYRPSRRLRDYVQVRDGHTSRFPTSGARMLELDHVEEFDHRRPAAGGATTASNLASSGQQDHHAKTSRLFRVSGDAGAALTYDHGTGHRYISRPTQYLDPDPPPEPDPDPPPESDPDRPPF